MKAAICTYALMIGGIERVIFQQARILQQLGYAVCVIETQQEGPWKSYFQSEGITVKSLIPKPWVSKRFHAKTILKELQGYDLVFPHDSIYTMAVISCLSPSVGVFPTLHSPLESMLDTATCNRGAWNSIICVSPFLQKLLLRERGIPAQQLSIIPTAVIAKDAIPSIHGRTYGKRILFIGRLSHFEKAVLHLPAIMEQLLLLHPDARLTIYGDGPDAAALKEAIARLNLHQQVQLQGYLPYDQVNETLWAHDFLILPSFFEGQGLIYLEAMAQGLIPVVSLLPDNTDVWVQSGSNGFLCEPGSVSDFVRALHEALGRRDLPEIAARAQATIRAHFTFEQMKEAYAALLAAHASQTPPSRRGGKLLIAALGEMPDIPLGLIKPVRKILKMLGLWK